MQRSWTEMLGDREEGPLFGALLSNPADAVARERYVRWLLARKEPRAELVRLGLRLAEGGEEEAARQALCARFTALQEDGDERWLALVLDSPPIRNCGQTSDPVPAVRFAYQCDRQWETLQPTSEPRVRYCGSCRQDVYRCSSFTEAATHAQRGECIAVEPHLVGEAYARYCRMVTGRPDPIAMWAVSQLKGRELPPGPKVPPPLPSDPPSRSRRGSPL